MTTFSRLLFLGVLASAITIGASAPLCADSRDRWQEETLLQLAELRKAQAGLAQQVKELRTEVAAMKGGGKQASKSVDLRDTSYPSVGEAKAAVAIVEFSDFECPYCRRHQQATLPQLMSSYVQTGRVRYYFLDFPLSFHARAQGAAIAAACAQQGGGFWKMHEKLFDRQRELGASLYPKIAAEIGLDSAAFEACLNDPKVKQGVLRAIAIGEHAGVQGTPAFLIGTVKDGVLTNAELVSGARPFTDFQRVIDDHLSRQ